MIRTGLIASAAALAVMLGAWAWLASALPADLALVPVHWGADGAADRFAARADALLLFGLLPAIGVGLAILLALIPNIDPLRENLMKGRRAYLASWIGGEAMLALVAVGVAYSSIQSATGGERNEFVRIIMAGVGVLFVFIGDALPKTRPNFFLGVRTPWTLTSDLSWEKTHRLAGRLFVLIGLWAVVAAFALNGLALTLAVAGPILATVVVAVVYSYLVWRSDENRRRPTQEV